MATKVKLSQEEGRRYFAATQAGASHEEAYRKATGRPAPGSTKPKASTAKSSSTKGSKTSKAPTPAKSAPAQRPGSGPAGNRGAQAAQARRQLTRGAQRVAGPGVGAVVKALVTAFALVLLLGVLLIQRPGGWSGAGVLSVLLNKLDGFFQALVSPTPFWTISGSGQSSSNQSAFNQKSPNYRATPAPTTGHPAAS